MKKNLIPLSSEGESPKSWYEKVQRQENFIVDPAQQRMVEVLDDLFHQLVQYHKMRHSLLKKMLKKRIPKSLYVWGRVGRGKSFLMDGFYNCLPFKEKKRVHFHAFMAEVHARLAELKDYPDPLMVFAKELAKDLEVLCFDEFHVSDIADAMILGRLLERVLNEGLIIVVTSNYSPDALYSMGQNRSSFLPTIALIKDKFFILEIDSAQDFRLCSLTNANVVLIPDSAVNTRRLNRIFNDLNTGATEEEGRLEVNGRSLEVVKKGDKIIWFQFLSLCAGPRSQQDYLVLAKHYDYVLISGLKTLTEEESDIARRFTWLIDILYDQHVKVVLTSGVSLAKLYTQGSFVGEFTRTLSRLTEMQSVEYLLAPRQSRSSDSVK
ncbi:MAG: cell division protein ZapE [Haemophilus parainfluenzae]|jgi:ATPase, AFG1 family|nr:MAG: cell division protein ZapE [Haemophilus parainfluenzae]